MKIDSVHGVYEVEVPEDSSALFVVSLVLEKMRVAGLAIGWGYLHEVADTNSHRVVGRRLAMDEAVDREQRYYFVSEQPVDA